jgi:hypothetical protein
MAKAFGTGGTTVPSSPLTSRTVGMPSTFDMAARPRAGMGMMGDKPKMPKIEAGIHYVEPHIAHSPKSNFT